MLYLAGHLFKKPHVKFKIYWLEIQPFFVQFFGSWPPPRRLRGGGHGSARGHARRPAADLPGGHRGARGPHPEGRRGREEGFRSQRLPKLGKLVVKNVP